MRLQIVLIFLFTGMITRTAFPQTLPVNVISLGECLKLAVENSPRLKISRLEQEKLKFKYREAVGKGLPNLNFSGALDDYVSLPTQLIPGEFLGHPGELYPVQFGTTYNLSGAVDATQLIYNQSFLVGLRIAKQMMEQSVLTTEKARTNLVFEVAQSYYLTQITKKQITNLESNIRQLEQVEKISRSQYESGLIKKIDADRILVQKLNLLSELDRAKVLFEQQQAMQKYYMGLPADQPLEFPDSISLSTVIPGTESSLSGHIDLRLIEQQRELAKINLRLQYSEYYPSLTFIGNINYSNQSNSYYLFGKSTDWFNMSLIGIRLNVPLFSGFQKNSKVSQSKIDLAEIKLTDDDTRSLLKIQSQDAARKLSAGIEAEKRQRTNVILAEKVYNVAKEQYTQGLIPLTDLLNAESALRDTQTGQTHAFLQMKLAELEYLNANGTLLTLVDQQ
jgi:outer membrane protein